ncbi:MAG: phosphoribosyltransferase family protein [Pseudohongiellaceae bacterium]|nr:phosphoribosyltransferase family protein [Pseudohongiellaceae bacterium]
MINLLGLLSECLLCGHQPNDNSHLCSQCHGALAFALNPCLRCGIELHATLGSRVCGQCLKIPPRIDYCHPVLRYHFPVPRLISHFKDHAQFAQGQLLAQLLAQSIKEKNDADSSPSLLVSVPLHKSRIRKRGFNQSAIIAKTIASHCGITYASDLCSRRHNTPTQRGLDKSARQRNLKNAFSITPNNAQIIRDAHIAIVDDVVTTTSTVNALAQELKSAGARTVGVYCLARVDKPGF